MLSLTAKAECGPLRGESACTRSPVRSVTRAMKSLWFLCWSLFLAGVMGLVLAAPAQAQYYPYYAYNPYSAGYCNPYYYPYGCASAYANPYAAYAYPYSGYGYG